jgi:hypothetical protein
VNLVATFSKTILAGTGNVVIKNLTNATSISIPIGSGQCIVSGNTLTINPTSDLASGKAYAIRIASTCIKDASGNYFAGILNDTTWNFSTASAPPASLGADISIDFEGDPLQHEIVWSYGAYTSPTIETDYPADYPYILEGLPYNTLINVKATAIDGIDESTVLDENYWTEPENAPTLTFGTRTESTIPVTLSVEGPNSEETGSGYYVEISNDAGATWAFQAPKFIAWNASPKTATFTGLSEASTYHFRPRSINVQPNPINESEYSPYGTTQSTTTLADSTRPTVTSITVDGDILTLGFSEPVNFGAGGSGGFAIDIDGGTQNIAASTPVGAGTNSIILTLASPVVFGDVLKLQYTQPGTGWRDLASTPNYLLSFSDVAASNITLESLDPDIVAQWRLNDGSGTTAQDDSANNYDLSIIGTPAWGSGYFDSSAGARLEAAIPDIGINGNAFTASCWVKRTGGDGGYLWRNSEYNNPGFIMYIDGTLNEAVFVTITTVRSVPGISIPIGVWTHYAITRGAGDVSAPLKFYINGVLVGNWTVPTFSSPPLYNFRIPIVDGHIDDNRVYDVEKDATFIANLYAAGRL